jgi:hypothetical protein
MGEVMRNGISPWRWNRWFRVRVIRRWQLRNFWPGPNDLEQMTPDALESYFMSIGLDEQIAAAMAEYRSETDQDPENSPIPAAQARASGRDSTRA